MTTTLPAGKQPCVRCGAIILDETARKTGGLCMPCKAGRREAMDEAARRHAGERAREAAEEQARAPLLARLAAGDTLRFVEFFHLDDPGYEVFHAATNTVYGGDVGRLSPECRLLYVLACYGGDVENAGFGSWITDASPGRLVEVLAGLEVIGAHVQAALLRRALRWFPEAMFTEDWQVRRRRYLDLCEREDFRRDNGEALRDAFYADWEHLYRLLEEYVHANPEAVITRQAP